MARKRKRKTQAKTKSKRKRLVLRKQAVKPGRPSAGREAPVRRTRTRVRARPWQQ